MKHQVTAILGAQWGDEGKGKIVDILAEEVDFVVRASGGANAGHTIVVGDKEYIFHLIPSGILHEKVTCVIGNGCVVHLETLLDEMSVLEEAGIDIRGRLFLSDRAHLVMPYHIMADKKQEESRKSKIGTTCRGIGPAYEDKANRSGIRAGTLVDNFTEFAEHFRENAEQRGKRYGFALQLEDELTRYEDLADRFADIIVDTLPLLHDALEAKKKILVEGAQGTHLDIDFGSYPYVTSSSTTNAGVCSGTGLPPKAIHNTIGILKAYTTRVGEGPFPSELSGELEADLRKKGGEYGATTGRPRRCGWFDVMVARHAALVSGIDAWNLTKLDVLTGLPTITVVTGYRHPETGELLRSFPSDLSLLARVELETQNFPGWTEDLASCKSFADLPKNAQDYCKAIEELTKVPLHSIGVGPKRDEMIVMKK